MSERAIEQVSEWANERKKSCRAVFPSYFQFELKRHKRNQLVSIHGLVLCELLIKYNSRPFFGNSRNIIGFFFFFFFSILLGTVAVLLLLLPLPLPLRACRCCLMCHCSRTGHRGGNETRKSSEINCTSSQMYGPRIGAEWQAKIGFGCKSATDKNFQNTRSHHTPTGSLSLSPVGFSLSLPHSPSNKQCVDWIEFAN